MKATQFLKTLVPAIAVALTIAACTQDDDYTTPTLVYPTLNTMEGTATTVSAVQARYDQAGEITTFDLEDDQDLFIEAYVVSSDQSGNFYEEIVLQSSPNAEDVSASNPRLGLKLLINEASLYTKYEVGRKVWVKLNGLSVGLDSGMYSLGKDDGSNYLGQIESWELNDIIFRSSETATITPKVVDNIGELTADDLGTFVAINNLQLSEDDFGKTFAGEASDTYQGERTFESCSGGNVVLYSSSYADFKSLIVPANNRGSIAGVFARDYYDDYNVMMINKTSDLQLDEERCATLFSENFSDSVDNTTLNTDGWLNYAEAGSTVWTEQVYSGNGYAEFNPYNSGSSSNIGWLITPSVDLSGYTSAALSFETEHAYPDAGHEPLDVLISTDFDGTTAGVTSATWTSIDNFDVSYVVDFDTWYSFTSSGSIDLSSYAGQPIYVAFRYTGSDSANQNMTLHVDNVAISVE